MHIISHEIKSFSSSEIIVKYDISGKIAQFLREIEKYNQSINIVSRETKSSDLIRMAADCLVPCEIFSMSKEEIFDIGPGAGFPSIIMMLAISNLKGTLFERTGKKARFSKRMINEFGLNAQVIQDDFIQSADKVSQGAYNFGFMKYVKIDKRILSKALELLRPTGKFIYFSRLDPNLALERLPIAINLYPYYLDDLDRVRHIAAFSSIDK
jgi:16S rRNA G527 N7-methylase RsmG